MDSSGDLHDRGEDALPVETWANIFHYLDGYTLVSATRTCRTFRAVADDQDIWQSVVLSYRKRNDVAMRFLPQPTEIAYSLMEVNIEADEDDDEDEEVEFSKLASLRNFLHGAPAEEGLAALSEDPAFQQLLEPANALDAEEVKQALEDPDFPRWFAKFRDMLPEAGESANRLLSAYPSLVAHFWKTLRQQSDKMKRSVLGTIDWKFVYIALCRTLTVHEELEYAGVITTSQLTDHTPIGGGDRKRLFYSLADALASSLPGDCIYLHSSEEEKLYPDHLRERQLDYPFFTEHMAEILSVAIHKDGLNAPFANLPGETEISGSPAEMIAALTARDPNYEPPPPGARTKVKVPMLAVLTPNLRIFGRGGGQLVDEAGAGLMMPLLWLAPGGMIATVDCVRGSVYVGSYAELTCLDVNFEVPVHLSPKATLNCLDCNILAMPGDVSWLNTPLNSLDWHLSIDRADFDTRIEAENLLALVGKLLTPPIAYSSPVAQALDVLRPTTQVHLRNLINSHSHELNALKLSIAKSGSEILPTGSDAASSNTDPRNIEDFSTEELEEIARLTTGPHELEKRRTQIFTVITTLLDQGIFDDIDVDPNLGNFVRTQLLKWLPFFADNVDIVSNCLNALRSIPEDRMLKLIDDLHLMDLIPELFERYINVDRITFALANIVTKICWCSDNKAILLGSNESLWRYFDILIGKVMGKIGADASEALGKPPGFYRPNPPKLKSGQTAPSSEASNLASSTKLLQNLSLSESIEVPKPAQTVFENAESFRQANAVITLTNMLWSLSSYPLPGTLVMDHAIDFMMWTGREFSSDASIIENVCGIGQALLDCLPFQDTSRPEAARRMLELGAMDIVLKTYKKLTIREAINNADYWGHLLVHYCPDLALQQFLQEDGLNVCIEALTVRVKHKFKVQQNIDFFTLLSKLVAYDEVWKRIKNEMEDMMFSMSTRSTNTSLIVVLARIVSTCPKRRLDLAHTGILNYILSITPSGYQTVATILDVLDSLSRDPETLNAKASELRECAMHMQRFAEEDDAHAWINSVLDAVAAFLAPEEPVKKPLFGHIAPILDPLSSQHEVKVSSDGLTCHVVEHCFHSFVMQLPEGKYLSSGKWVYEVSLNSDGPMQIGWATKRFKPSVLENLGVGDDVESWGGDFNRLIIWHAGIEGEASNFRCLNPDMPTWVRGSLLTVAVDFDNRLMMWSMDGTKPMKIPFPDDVEGVVPAFTLARGESVTVNIGQHPIVHYKLLQMGFSPVKGPVEGGFYPNHLMEERQQYHNRRADAAQEARFAHLAGPMFDGMGDDFLGDEDEEDDEFDEDGNYEEGEEDEEGDEEALNALLEEMDDEDSDDDENDDGAAQRPPRRGVANRYAFARR